ncbi:MAG: sce7726 family protein [Clostridium sp.]|nr:sce7726 family protein [Clostridium sp.]
METLRDRDIREPLFDFLEEVYGKIRIIEEKAMGKSRADVVMVTPDLLYGIEIKSDADTYARLERQVGDYDLYYDRNYAVVGTSHAMHIEEHLPAWWGIITVELAEGKADFYILRKPLTNPKTDWKKKIGILWRPELAHIQELNGLPKYKEKSKLFVQKKLMEKVPADILQRQLCEELFERDYTEIKEQIQEFRAESGKGRRGRKRGKKPKK